MLPFLFRLILDLSSSTAAAQPLHIVPGVRIGPLALGMTRAELERAGAKRDDHELTLGPLSVTLDGRERASRISLHLLYQNQDRLRIGESFFRLRFLEHTGDELVKLLPGCARPRWTGEERLWRSWRCSGIRVGERLADGDPEMTIEVVAR